MICIVISGRARGERRWLKPWDGGIPLDPVTVSLRLPRRVSGGFAAFWR
jgi:hypothetical protein